MQNIKTLPATPSDEELAALQRFANQNGYGWKARLTRLWVSGEAGKGDDAPVLRKMRNNFGPHWLYSRKCTVKPASPESNPCQTP